MNAEQVAVLVQQMTQDLKADNDRYDYVKDLEGQYAAAMREYDRYVQGPGWPDDEDQSYDASMLRRAMHHKATLRLARAMSINYELSKARRAS